MCKNKKKDKIIMFGASSAGVNFINEYQDKYEILGIADNDTKKQGTMLLGFPIIEPLKIKNHEYDFVMITSSFLLQIKEQLLEELNISPEKIKAVPKSNLYASKCFRPFENEETINLARESLLFLIKILESDNIPYFVDHGTLLGIVRDGDIIPWDDDIDLSVDANDMEKVIACIYNNISGFPMHEDLGWIGNIKYNQEDKPCSITIKFNNERKLDINKFPISITGNFFKDGLAIQNVTYAPEHHFMQHEYVMYENRQISVPYQHEAYLEYHYGEWKKPKKDISFLDVLNYKDSGTEYTKLIL